MARADGIGEVDLAGGTYTVKEGLVRDQYRVYDSDGELVLEADRRELRAQQEFHFRDTDGNVAFSVQEGNVDGDFFIVPPDTDRPLVILERDSALLGQEWNVRHGSNERLLATIEARATMLEFFRYYVPMMGVLPHTYTIESTDGEKLGKLAGQYTLSDSYELDVETANDTNREPLVAAALSIDALDVN
jgi:uncharacterized protein YxjI